VLILRAFQVILFLLTTSLFPRPITLAPAGAIGGADIAVQGIIMFSMKSLFALGIVAFLMQTVYHNLILLSNPVETQPMPALQF